MAPMQLPLVPAQKCASTTGRCPQRSVAEEAGAGSARYPVLASCFVKNGKEGRGDGFGRFTDLAAAWLRGQVLAQHAAQPWLPAVLPWSGEQAEAVWQAAWAARALQQQHQLVGAPVLAVLQGTAASACTLSTIMGCQV